jgi:hypothetical protein
LQNRSLYGSYVAFYLIQKVTNANVVTPIKVETFKKWLLSFPEKELQFLFDGFTYGFTVLTCKHDGGDCRVLQILLRIALKLQIGKDYDKKK